MAVAGSESRVTGLREDALQEKAHASRGVWSCYRELLLALALALTSRGAEHTIWNGDKRSVEFLYEDHFHRNIPLVGKRDLPVESQVGWVNTRPSDMADRDRSLQFEYGIRAGLPRILKLFKKYDYKFTGWFCARALEVHGDYGKLIVEHGHEASRLRLWRGYDTRTVRVQYVLTSWQIACHGNRWRGTMDLAGPDAEAADIRKSFDRLQAATGRTDVPTAYFTGSGSAMHNHVRARVHKERGVPLLYCSDAYADDLPYYVTSPLALDGDKDEGLLMIPYSLTNNDREFHGAAVLRLRLRLRLRLPHLYCGPEIEEWTHAEDTPTRSVHGRRWERRCMSRRLVRAHQERV